MYLLGTGPLRQHCPITQAKIHLDCLHHLYGQHMTGPKKGYMLLKQQIPWDPEEATSKNSQ